MSLGFYLETAKRLKKNKGKTYWLKVHKDCQDARSLSETWGGDTFCVNPPRVGGEGAWGVRASGLLGLPHSHEW